MKKALFLAALVAALVSVLCADPAQAEECSRKGINLHGKVKVVENFPDLTVKTVTSFPDLKVKQVSSFPDRCGEWQFVDNFPDFTIKFVENFPDLTIQFVDTFPGMR